MLSDRNILHLETMPVFITYMVTYTFVAKKYCFFFTFTQVSLETACICVSIQMLMLLSVKQQFQTFYIWQATLFMLLHL